MKNQTPFRIKLFIFVLTMFGVCVAQSQITLQAGGGLGVAFPAGDFGGSTMDYYSGTKYGLSTGFNLHGKIRAGLTGITLMGEVGYSSLTNKGNAEPPAQGNVEVSQKIVSVKVGPEYHFKLPAAPLEPYVGANLALNLISGETTFQGVSKVSSATYSVKSASRFGIGLNGGTIFSLGPLVSLDIALQYNIMNLFGKGYEDVNPSQNQRIDAYLALNDNPDPAFAPNDDKHFISSSRTIHSFMLTASLIFGL